jgi:hypothetical protein
MNRFIIFFVIILGIGVYFLFNSSEEIKNPLNDSQNSQKVLSNSFVSENNKIDNKLMSNNFKNNTSNLKDNTPYKNGIKSKDIDTKSTKKDIEQFIEENNLVLVSSNKDIKIYAKDRPVKDEFAPPMPPVFIKVKFKDKEDIISLDPNLIKSNEKIYIINKSEIKDINTKNIFIYMPPSVGQK